ncbi:MAG: asparaginase [Eubacterium sp.]|nr:asparaginase [Eubacterium sp.]
MKILVVGTGGTIACVRDGDVIRLENPFAVTEYEKRADVNFICLSPFAVLSENMNADKMRLLADFISDNRAECDGVIVLHGSDTLAYTAAYISNALDGNIVLTASNKPIGEEGSNGVANFKNAVDYIAGGGEDVVVSYDGICPAKSLVSANDNDEFLSIDTCDFPTLQNPKNKNIVIIHPYPEIDYSVYDTDKIGAVIHTMYHSATVPDSAKEFCKACKEKGIPFYFVTSKPSADYETAQDIDNIIFSTTTESLYTKLLLMCE